jgi:hypothetical protein
VSREPRRCVAPVDAVPQTMTLGEAVKLVRGLADRLASVAPTEAHPDLRADDWDIEIGAHSVTGRLYWDHGDEDKLDVAPIDPLCGKDATTERTVEGVVMPLCEEHAAEIDAEKSN